MLDDELFKLLLAFVLLLFNGLCTGDLKLYNGKGGETVRAAIGGSILWNHPSSDLWPLYISLVHIIQLNEITKFSKE